MIDFKQLYTYTKALKILYVEDEEMVRNDTKELLSNFFPLIDTGKDGEEGLNKYKSYYDLNHTFYDIVITDINMPKMSGIQMTEEILKLHDDQLFIVISAYSDTERLIDMINMGVSQFILKPIQAEQFYAGIYKVSQQLAERNLAKDYYQQIEVMNKELESKILKRTEELHRQLYIDGLTGLRNRNSLMEVLHEIGQHFMMFVDIDRFKFYNDLYGLDVGNTILNKFSNFLENYANEHKYEVFRLSGDEFILLRYMECNVKDQCGEYLNHLQQAVQSLNIYIEKIDENISLEVTIGGAFGESDVLTHADMALKYAKEGYHAASLYTPDMDMRSSISNIITWKDRIKKALQASQVTAVYQPILDREGKIVKFEALMRIIDEDENGRQLISPFYFLDIARQTKLYQPLSTKIISTALDHIAHTSDILSVNLSFDDIMNEAMCAMLVSRIKNSEIGGRIIFELTETETLQDYDLVREFVKLFRPYGVRIAIDDFGSGYSNFQHILELEPDYLKIDGSLIKNITSDKSSLSIVKAILLFSHEQGIKVIAEYVHNKEVYELLYKLGVDEFQGYYFSEPLEDISMLS